VNPWLQQDWLFESPGKGRALSHAMLPTPLVLDDRIRVYFAACDANLRGRVYRVDLERDRPHRVIEAPTEPVLDLGPPGSFDADGVNPSQVMWVDGKLWLYYIGWRRISAETPYTLFGARSVSDDGGLSFANAPEPMLPPSVAEPLFRTAPFVYRSGERWAVLYIGGGRFVSDGDKRLPIYSLCQAFSDDGLHWPTTGRELLAPCVEEGELGFGRPLLWIDDNKPSLYLSLRTRSGYQLMHTALEMAEAGERRFETVLDFLQMPWAARMTCFGAPCRVGQTELLFYNGNQFGRTGFGLATRRAKKVSGDGSG
jgi:hypothetical protein